MKIQSENHRSNARLGASPATAATPQTISGQIASGPPRQRGEDRDDAGGDRDQAEVRKFVGAPVDEPVGQPVEPVGGLLVVALVECRSAGVDASSA